MAPAFSSFSEYENYLEMLQRVGTISKDDNTGKADGTKIWWDIRPHPKFGTLEVRIPDICTKVEEAVCLAAILQSLTATLIDLRQKNQSWRIYRSHHIVENKWRAMRYGIDGKLVDFGKEEEVPMSFLAIEIVELVEKQAKALGCWEEVRYVETILKEGSSADRQIRTYEKALNKGASQDEALQAVVDKLIQETMEGI